MILRTVSEQFFKKRILWIDSIVHIAIQYHFYNPTDQWHLTNNDVTLRLQVWGEVFCPSLTFISTCPPPGCRSEKVVSSLPVSLLTKLRHSLHLPPQLFLLCVLLKYWRKPHHLLQHKAQTPSEFLHPRLISCLALFSGAVASTNETQFWPD